MIKSLSTLFLLIAGIMIAGRAVNSAENEAQLLDEEFIVLQVLFDQ